MWRRMISREDFYVFNNIPKDLVQGIRIYLYYYSMKTFSWYKRRIFQSITMVSSFLARSFLSKPVSMLYEISVMALMRGLTQRLHDPRSLTFTVNRCWPSFWCVIRDVVFSIEGLYRKNQMYAGLSSILLFHFSCYMLHFPV